MRAQARPNDTKQNGRKQQQADHDCHMDALMRFAKNAQHRGLDTPSCTLFLRSAKSAPARALKLLKEPLAAARIEIRAILLTLEPEQEFRELLDTLALLAPDEKLETRIRWARDPRLLDAHEQTVYGTELCWTGDTMRREAGKRNALALFETEPEALVRGALAFRALWGACDDIPPQLLDRPTLATAAKTTRRAQAAPVAALKPPPEGWPLVRH